MTISYDVAGDGPTVLLLHAGVCDRRMWDPQVVDLVAAGFRVVRPDLRGFGETPLAPEPFNHADDVIAVLDEVGAATTAMVGASMGGAVAQEVAARFPARVSSLVLLCAAAADFVPSARLAEFGAKEDVLLEAGDVAGAVELNVDMWVRPGADASVADQVRVMQGRAFELQLAAVSDEEFEVEYDVSAITASTLAVSGAHDVPDFRDIAVGVSKAVEGARHVELDWAGHLPSMERPADTTALILAHIG